MEKFIVYERGSYFVLRVAKGFEVYRQGATAAARCAQCGYAGQKGLDWCKAEIERRLTAEKEGAKSPYSK